jgi:hypothetical protein
MFITPVLLLGFNRPKKVKEVINALRMIKPSELYISLDGPRKEVPSDIVQIEKVKDELKEIDWKCNVYKNFSKTNLGCKLGVYAGISWFFEHVESGIILEDDIVPNTSFFNFCTELLERYKEDREIGMISGCNMVSDKISIPYSYTFSNYANIWGWATWRRSWVNMDIHLNHWNNWRKNPRNFKTINPDIHLFELYWRDILDSIQNGKVDTWDFQWFFTLWFQKQLCIVPKGNLVQNVGFDSEATHTDGTLPHYIDKNPITELKFPIQHPQDKNINIDFDKIVSQVIFKIGLKTILKNKLSRNTQLKYIYRRFKKYF